MTKIEDFIKKNKTVCSIVPPVAIALIIAAVISKTDFWQLFPLLISLVVMLLQSTANRYAFLLGGINSLIYTAVYISFELYSSAASAFFLSFPIQILTFVTWSKRKYKQSTSFRQLSPLGYVSVILSAFACYFIITPVFSLLGSSYMVIDNVGFTLSLLTSTLSLLSFREFPYFQIIGILVSSAINISVLANDFTILPHLIYNLYALLCSIFTCINAARLYREQHSHN